MVASMAEAAARGDNNKGFALDMYAGDHGGEFSGSQSRCRENAE
jgi:hypothetical protein